MNIARRKALSELYDIITEAKERIEMLCEEEQDYMDNICVQMPYAQSVMNYKSRKPIFRFDVELNAAPCFALCEQRKSVNISVGRSKIIINTARLRLGI